MGNEMTALERVQIARRPQRPGIRDYIDTIFPHFFEMRGDRLCGEDEAILGGVALYHGQPVTVIGTRKGRTLQENLRANFGMPSPEGYRKALRLMQQAEKFHRPIITLIDTSGAYPGMNELMRRHKAEGGYICVVSHSFDENIRRDYAENGLPEPYLVFGWEQPPERRKPNPWPLEEIMRRLGLAPTELLMIDDLKPGFDMAHSCGVDFAAAGWAYDVPKIEDFMRRNSDFYFKTVQELADFLGE